MQSFLRNPLWFILAANFVLWIAPYLSPARVIDTVRVGSPQLRGAKLRLGTETIHSFMLHEGVKRPISTTTQTIWRGREGGQNVYIVRSIHVGPRGDTTAGTIVVRESDFALIRHKVKGVGDSAAIAFSGAQITGWVVLPEEPIRLLDLRVPEAVFPIEGQIPWLLTVLPFREGFAAAIPHFSEWEGEEVWKNVKVISSEDLQRDRRRVECWKVDTGQLGPPGYRAIRRIEKSTGRILQSVLRGSEGGPEYWSLAE